MSGEFGVGRCKLLLHFEWLIYICLSVCLSIYLSIYLPIYSFIYLWVTLLYSRNWHNILNQLYFNNKKMI